MCVYRVMEILWSCGRRPKLTAVVLLVLSPFPLFFLYSSVSTANLLPKKPLHLFVNWSSRIISNSTNSSRGISSSTNSSRSSISRSTNSSRSSISNSTNSRSSSSSPQVLHEVAVVTAFLDIGEFGKGAPKNKRDWHIYQRWSSAYSQLQAPVVMYTNSPTFAKHFLSVRQHLHNMTLVRHVDLSDLWSFGLQPQIAAIYSRGYPKHWPNTVYPRYTCVTHAKFDLLHDVMEKGLFASRLIAWMDIGYLRDVVGKNDTYIMHPPQNFDPQRVLCGEVNTPNFTRPWKSILRHNVNWVAGGFFLARRDVMTTFVEQYRRAVTSFLRHQETQVEQQILHAMYTKEGRAIVHPTVELQAPHGGWFTAGFSCLHPLHPQNTTH
ncbi:hypothetical protein ACOMHN_024753 [Nucella lapillus]